jgi:alpha-amylase/alpha-mannosidase (GH57 family)
VGRGRDVKPRIHLVLLWHQHQPLYRDPSPTDGRVRFVFPWVRLHAIRDYYSMAAVVAEHAGVHLTINLTPALLLQIQEYAERGATDGALDLTLRPAEELGAEEREELLSSFFDAHWHHQIFPHPRYAELFDQRARRQPFALQDLRDLQMWSNLAWFGQEFRTGKVELVTGHVVAVHELVEQGAGYTSAQIQGMAAEQLEILRAVIPIHDRLQREGQIEVSTTPFYHPILPLLVDIDRATIDRAGTTLPRRFAYPEDAEAQTLAARDFHQRCFGRPALGMWPAEGAVSQSVIPIFARSGARWIATDQGVLARSGRWGYRTEDPNVLCQPYRAEEGEHSIAVFFRDTQLSDRIGFQYANAPNHEHAARDFVEEIKQRFAHAFRGDEEHVLTVALDGENAWSSYPDDGRTFLHALYRLLENDPEIRTVTPAEYLEGNPARGVAAHPLQPLARVHDLFTGSWIDENGSAPGVDLGTWIGEAEENKAWELLGRARDLVARSGATPEANPTVFESLYSAEGSDWFWWLGDDQSSGYDAAFEGLFRAHLSRIYAELGVEPPADLGVSLIPAKVVWTFSHQVLRIGRRDVFVVQTNCPGELAWNIDGTGAKQAPLIPVGGVMAGVARHQISLGTMPAGARELAFRFLCRHKGCDCDGPCCRAETFRVEVVGPSN